MQKRKKITLKYFGAFRRKSIIKLVRTQRKGFMSQGTVVFLNVSMETQTERGELGPWKD